MSRTVINKHIASSTGGGYTSSDLQPGEIGINYQKGNESILIKNTANQIINYRPVDRYLINVETDGTNHTLGDITVNGETALSFYNVIDSIAKNKLDYNISVALSKNGSLDGVSKVISIRNVGVMANVGASGEKYYALISIFPKEGLFVEDYDNLQIVRINLSSKTKGVEIDTIKYTSLIN